MQSLLSVKNLFLRNYWSHIFLLSLFFVNSASAVFAESATEGSGNEIFAKTCKFYNSLPTLSGDVFVRKTIVSPDSRKAYVHKLEFVYRKNGPLFYLRMKDADNKSQVLLKDGKVEIYYSKWNRTATKACSSFSELIKSPDFNLVTDSCFTETCLEALTQAPERLSTDVETITIEKQTRYGGDTCSVLNLHRKFADTRLWIRVGAKPYIRKIEPLRKLLTGKNRDTFLSMESRFTRLGFRSDGHVPRVITPSNVQRAEHLLSGSDSPSLEKLAPPLNLRTVGGGTFDTARYKSKIIVLDFWATWCGPCKRGLQALSELADSYSNAQVSFVAVNKEETADRVKEFVRANSLNLIFALDPYGKACKKYTVASIPHTVIIGNDGRVKFVHIGNSTSYKSEIDDDLNSLLKLKSTSRH